MSTHIHNMSGHFIIQEVVYMIVCYKLENIQSWSANSPIVELSNNLPNIIIAKSETGKSVFVKILKEMCFPGSFDYTNSSLIRRGCNSGKLVIMLDNGDVIIYEIFRNNHHRHQYLEKIQNSKDGSYDISTFNDYTEVPEVIANKLGLLLDRSSKTIVNIVDKHSPIPFVSSDLEGNARILSVSTENPKIESSIDTINGWIQELKSAAATDEVLLSNLYRTLSMQPKIDNTLEIIDRIDIKKQILPVVREMEKVISIFDELEPVVANKPVDVKFINLDNEIKLMSNLTTINNELFSLQCIVDTKPISVMKIDLEFEMKMIHDISNVLMEFDSIETITSNKVIMSNMIDPLTIQNDIDFLSDIKDCFNLIIELHNLFENKPVAVYNATHVESIVNVISKSPDFDNIFEEYYNYYNLCKLVDSYKRSILKIEEEIKVCPTCGKPF